MGSTISFTFYCIYMVQFITSITLNILILWLIAKRYSNESRNEEYIHKYRILLGHMALACIRASFTFSVLQMCVHLRPLAAIITTKGPILSIFGHTEVAFIIFRILFSDVCGVICIMSMSYALAAFYRYTAIARNKALHEFITKRNITCALISVHLFGLAVTVLGYSGMTWDQQFLISYFPIGNGHMDFDTLYIGSHFSERSLMRARTLAAQKLLVHALLIQAFLPTMLVIPLFVVTLLTLAMDTPPLLEYFSFSLIGWLPVLDPIITIYFVLPFRRLMLAKMPRLLCHHDSNMNSILCNV
uniref:G protein-coupled receptor n=1 Tax=Ascaris lumbricoides TaxID=6252 RepID=A0A0M3I828_ASCLU